MTQELTMIHSLEALSGQQLLENLELMAKRVVTMPPAIPIEQIKGDISRAGHPVQRIMALDPDSRRLFFTDVQGNFMYAEFAEPAEAYRVIKIGFQAEIAREYGAALEKAFDPVDLEAEPRDVVTTGHEEREVETVPEPGILPPGTPGEKPDDIDHDGFGDFSTVPSRARVGDIKDRREENTGFNQRAHDEQMKKGLQDALTLGELGQLVKQPPRPGLVPQSGDPQHPGRWVRPREDVAFPGAEEHAPTQRREEPTFPMGADPYAGLTETERREEAQRMDPNKPGGPAYGGYAEGSPETQAEHEDDDDRETRKALGTLDKVMSGMDGLQQVMK